jgi:hypothetical protein
MKQIFFLLLLLLNNTYSFCLNFEKLPPINNIYVSSLKIPLLGKQDIYIERITKDTASLKIEGIVNTNGLIYYHKMNNNDYNYTFDENINNVMNKYKVSMSNINYDNNKDISEVSIKIKLLNLKRKLIFENINNI